MLHDIHHKFFLIDLLLFQHVLIHFFHWYQIMQSIILEWVRVIRDGEGGDVPLKGEQFSFLNLYFLHVIV